ALLSGVQIMPVPGERGAFTAAQVSELIRPENVHHPQTRLICLENTHNRTGGSIFPLDSIKEIYDLSREKNIAIHLDGARLWNASVATGISIAEYCRYSDSVSMCFSKGLGAPVGSVIAGSREFIERARYYRKVYGGGMRQSGILAAAAIYAVENHIERLAEDHRRARKLAEFIAELPGIAIDPETVQTNIVVFDLTGSGWTGEQFINALFENGVKMLTFAGTRIRAVTHLHITDEDISRTESIIRKVWNGRK
ncbi:MAG: GntG family PLP-dependent aldolase, partial [Calditrichia bacterium]